MSLADSLGYRYQRQNLFQRMAARLMAFGPLAKLGSLVLVWCDRQFLRITKGRQTLTSWASGLPVIWVTTTGARTGQLRTSPLLGIPTGEDLALIGSGFGQPATPGWVYNLEADPGVKLSYRDRSIGAQARVATEEEEAEIWSTASRLYPGYRFYRERVANRKIRVFVLETG